jgi:hypothetical protein
MAVTCQEWTLTRGEAASLVLTGPAGVDPTGWTLLFTAASALGATPIDFAGTDPVVTVGGSGPWTLTVPLTRAHSSELTFDRGYWDIWRIDAGFEAPLASGTLIVKTPVRPPAAA